MRGIAVLRFDFTGLGASEGEFANTTFSSNVDDLVAAADHLRKNVGAPAILIGHSLGGAAVLAAAHRIPDARAVVTIAAPFDPAHVAGPVRRSCRRDQGEGRGGGARSSAGRSASAANLLDDIAEQKLCRPHRRSAQGAAGLPFADRRHRRHRQCQQDLSRRQASQELRLAVGRRSSAAQAARCQLCGPCHRRLGRALSRAAGRGVGRRDAEPGMWSCARRATAICRTR